VHFAVPIHYPCFTLTFLRYIPKMSDILLPALNKFTVDRPIRLPLPHLKVSAWRCKG
jgi:hypothetical protein